MKILRLLLPVFIFFLLSAPVFAAETPYGELAEALPPSVAEKLPEEVISNGEISVETFGFDYFGEVIAGALSESLFPAVSSLGTLLGVLLLSASVRLFCPDKGDVISLITCAAMGLYIIDVEAETAAAVESFSVMISTFVTALAPAVSALHVSTANTLTASVSATGFLFFSGAVGSISTYFFIPIYKSALGFAVINTVSKGTSARVFALIKRIFVTSLSALALIYITVLSYQTSLAAAADTVAARGVKFVLSSSVPIIGGALGDAVRTTAAGLGVIKSGSGALGIAVMLLLAAPVMIRLALSSAVYSVLSFAASFLGCDREDDLFTELGGAVGFALATVSIITVVFIISAAIFIKTAPAVGI